MKKENSRHLTTNQERVFFLAMMEKKDFVRNLYRFKQTKGDMQTKNTTPHSEIHQHLSQNGKLLTEHGMLVADGTWHVLREERPVYVTS